MGVLNATPDSFSDGGRFAAREAALAHALAMIEAGADIIDIGGESTRPGADPVPADEEIARTAPLIEAIRTRTDAVLSIDTMKPVVARAAFAAGATIWNDVAALREEGALAAAADLGAPVILMHMQGEPRTMQANPTYADVVAEVIAFLQARVRAAEAAGLTQIWVDPGIGFGKTLAHNLALIDALPRIIAETGRPLLFGASRKSLIAKIDPRAGDPMARLGGSLALALAAADAGADIVRVHDVRETAQALAVRAALNAAAARSDSRPSSA
ncbi:MAG: dihydropteroate synthase [Hydrogenophilaceae bacterium]|jgi:dihydropteroate synthase|nr:dihydropteroate synthase [Hydrogenophilaceae bacterium]